MDRSAIDAIRSDSAIESLNNTLATDDLPVAFVPDSASAVALEKYALVRNRFRGQMTTASLEDFAEYVSVHSEHDQSACFVDAGRMQAKAIFNLGDKKQPGHCDNAAVLALKTNVDYQAVLDLNGSIKNQKDFAEWMEDWADLLTATDDNGDTLELKKAIQAVRNQSFESKNEQHFEEGTFKSQRSAIESIEAKSKGNALPARLYFSTKPYLGFSDYTVELRVSVRTGGDKPALVARIIGLESMQQSMAEEFQSLVDDAINTHMKTYIGQFSA